MECILSFFDLVGIYRILLLYMRRNTALVLAPLPLAMVFASYSFYWGDAAEEICFPFLVWGLYFGTPLF